MTKRKTVRVRIAVAVDVNGKWDAKGWTSNGKQASDDLMADVVRFNLQRHHVVFIEADIPLPQTIKGKVTAKGGKK